MPLIDGDKLLELVPHREENVLLDRADCPLAPGGTEGNAWLNLAKGDAAGRDIFLYEAGGEVFLLSPVVCEFVALASVCVLKPDLAEDEICFFSAISNVKFNGRVRSSGELTTEVNRHRDRRVFKRFSGVVSDDTGELVSADIMAYVLKDAEQDAGTGGKKSEPPDTSLDEVVDKAAVFPEKSPWMTFADSITDWKPDALTLTTRYTYPADHPLTKGHFPDNPVMMGVAQWIAVEDAARLLAIRMDFTGIITVTGEIVRPDGTLVADVKNLVLEMGDGVPVTRSLLRIGFRGMVRPKEEVFARVTVRKDA